MRRLPALLTAAALATVLASSLSACSGVPGFAGCDRPYPSGDTSDIVEATGALGSKPTVNFPTPLVADGSEVSTIKAGEGDPIPERGTVDFEASVLYGKTGQDITSSPYDDTALLRVAGVDDSLSKSMQCAQVGERYALTTTAKEAFGEGALSQAGIGDDDSIVVVVDVIASYLGSANGVNLLPQDGMPTVVTAPDGQPGVAVPPSAPPTETRVETVKAGGGAEVKDGDSVVLHYSTFGWPATVGDKPSEIDSSWAGAPKIATVPGTADAAEALPPPGVLKLLTGAKVGSQLLFVIPASEAYPGGPPTNVEAGSTLIVVVDVLGIQK